MPKLPISVIIPAKNEAANLPRCLEAIPWADEIIIVDSASSDATPEIAKKFGARIVQFNYVPPWPKKKQWALDNIPLKNDWVLLLDADEVMPANSEAVFRPIVASQGAAPNTLPSAYWLNRRFFFLGQPLKHAYTPNWNLRLFRKSSCHFERLTSAETNSGDNEIHEHLICSGQTAKLGEIVMDHYAFPTVAIFFEKHLRYASWEAAVELHPFKTGEKPKGAAAFRRILKTISRKLPFRPFLRFLWVYFGEKAFLDGIAGYHFARLHGLYEYLIELKKYEMKT
jgi:glycosyltransferase involved in cell wall biosynthesis